MPIKCVDWPTLRALLKARKARLVDVREAQEFRQGHIPTSINVPLQTVQAELASWDRQGPLVFSCQSGKRCTLAANVALAMGFQDVSTYPGSYGEFSSMPSSEQSL